jgi:hypothetical protein
VRTLGWDNISRILARHDKSALVLIFYFEELIMIMLPLVKTPADLCNVVILALGSIEFF